MAESETLPARPSALPDAWISRIFEELSGLYGSKFTAMWRETDLTNVKRVWAKRLAGFSDKPDAIRSALDSCDARGFPPTCPEFLSDCRVAALRIGPKVLALPEPQIDPEVAAARARQVQRQAEKAIRQPLSYAYALKIMNDIASGVVVMSDSEKFACEALRNLAKLSEAPAGYVALHRAPWIAVQPRQEAA